jgi:coenzyme F420 hydrogenase subunit beta
LACPRVSLPKRHIESTIFENAKRDEDFGYYLSVVSARCLDESIRSVAQDGGVVTALLTYALEQGIIDSAITVKHENWKPIVAVCKSKEDLIASAGSVYSYATLMPYLR